MTVSEFLTCGEWVFYLLDPDIVQMYRHRDGAVATVVVLDNDCTVFSPYLPFPLYVVNQLRLMLKLDAEVLPLDAVWM